MEASLAQMIHKLKNQFKLFIFDVNGVLDNPWRIKKQILSSLVSNGKELVKVIIEIEAAYEANKDKAEKNIWLEAMKKFGVITNQKIISQCLEKYHHDLIISSATSRLLIGSQ